MKSFFDNPFHDSGTDQDPSFKKKVLAQRKWIILAASLLFFTRNQFLTFSGDLLFFQLDIPAEDTSISFALCGSAFLFFLYMILSSFPYFVKYKHEKRALFNALQIEERDQFSSEINAREGEKTRVSLEIEEKQKERSELAQQAVNERARLTEMTQSFQLEDRSSKKEGPLGFPTMEPSDVEQAKANRERIKNFILEEAEQALKLTSQKLDHANKTLEKLKDEYSSLERVASDLNAQRAALTSENRRRWQRHFKLAVAADFVSFIPVTLAIIYVALSFCELNGWI